MSSSKFRGFILLLVTCALVTGDLLVAKSASADAALFRILQGTNGFPNPPVTPGGAGKYIGYLIPYTLTAVKTGGYMDPPETAKVAPGNPVGGAFSLPSGFVTSEFNGSITPKTGWPGYTTTYFYHVYNGPGKFAAGNVPAAYNRMVFPTTDGNPIPNLGSGNPVTPTTTFGGRYDQSRAGSLRIEPGDNQFGGTFRLFSRDTGHWDQYIYYFTPALYVGYGDYFCFANGMYDCQPDTFVSPRGTTQVYNGIWWLLTAGGTAKQTTATKGGSTTLTPGGNASYLKRVQHYLNLVHPWTTGKASAFHQAGNQGTGVITPMGEGYDSTFPKGTTKVVLKRNYNANYNKTHPTTSVTTTTSTPYTQTLTGVTRIVSMVRPKLIWTMSSPIDLNVDPVVNIWNPVRMGRLEVYFLPEPEGMLMLGAGIATLLGLSRMRRH